jgi:Transcription elongation factor
VQYIDQTGKTARIKIVGVDEVDPLNGLISWISPVARALLKSREGDTVTLESPTGLQTLDIIEVSYVDSALA